MDLASGVRVFFLVSWGHSLGECVTEELCGGRYIYIHSSELFWLLCSLAISECGAERGGGMTDCSCPWFWKLTHKTAARVCLPFPIYRSDTDKEYIKLKKRKVKWNDNPGWLLLNTSAFYIFVSALVAKCPVSRLESCNVKSTHNSRLMKSHLPPACVMMSFYYFYFYHFHLRFWDSSGPGGTQTGETGWESRSGEHLLLSSYMWKSPF